MKWLHSRTAVVALVAVVAVLTICLGTWQGWLAEAQTVRWVNDAADAGEPTECSTATAYANIAAALGASADGDTIRLCEGTYAGNVTVNKSVTIEGRDGAARADVVIDVPAGAPTDGLILDHDNVIIRHLTLDGPGGQHGIHMAAPGYDGLTISDVEATDWNNAIQTDYAENMVVEDSNIHDNVFDGLRMSDGKGNVVRNNTITDNAADGLDLAAEDEFLLDRNTLSGNVDNQIEIWGKVNMRIWRNSIVNIAGSDGIVIENLPAEAFVQIGGSAMNANSFSGPFGHPDYYVQQNCFAENTVDATYNYWGGAGLSRSDIANRIFNDEDDVPDAECAAADHGNGAVVFHPWATAPAPTPSPSPTPTPSPTVTPTPSATRTFDLATGWNNFVWTGANGTAAEAALSCIAGNYAIAYRLMPASQNFERYVPGRCAEAGMCTLTTVNKYDSLLVLVTASGVQCKDMPVNP